MKTVSLELEKLLKEKGFPQETAFYLINWHQDASNEKDELKYGKPDKDLMYFTYAAPTADEILDLLPDHIKKDGEFYFIVIIKTPTEYGVRYENSGKIDYIGTDGGGGILEDSLADAAAKMWLYLKENNLL